jgi:hypothetical protein
VARRVEEATVERGAASSPLSPPPPHQRLLTFHAASSMSNTIRYGDLFCKWVIPFWDRNMPPRRFRASKRERERESGPFLFAWFLWGKKSEGQRFD